MFLKTLNFQNKIQPVCLALLLLPAMSVHAAPKAGMSFSHQDWMLACDNTRTCRAAGYQLDDGSGWPVSVLLTRKAGANQPVQAEVKLGNTGFEDHQPEPKSVQLFIDAKNLGKVILEPEALSGHLNAIQTSALLSALTSHTVIQLKSGQDIWTLSGQGAAAVLLKMDDIQGRIGTPGALMRKGNKAERSVLPPNPTPVVKQVKPLITPALTQLAKSVDLAYLNTALLAQQAKSGDDGCPLLTEGEDYAKFELTVEPLNKHKLLASGLCWRGAYNEGYGYWVINAKKPYQPQLVTIDASEYSEGVIYSYQKGRGIGDCMSNEDWTWNGQQFIQTYQATTGMCRLVELGGAWEMPTVITEVK